MKCRVAHRVSWLAALIALTSLKPAISQTFQELYSFAPQASDGDGPHGPLIQAKDGNFYGTTFYGGTWGFGTIFKMTQSAIITTMSSLDGTNNDRHPITGLVEASDGNFYCATVAPSRILKITPSGTLTIFGYLFGTVGELLQAHDGYLYLADSGDDNYGGFVSRVHPGTADGQVLYRFDYNTNYEKGYRPSGGLIEGTDGNFYGVTSAGGAEGYGVVYRLTTNGGYTVMASFSVGAGDGAVSPYGRLLQASDGNFYGVASGDEGTIFKMTPQGTLTTIAHFNDANGENPTGGLIEANDGNFYGTATHYGAYGVDGGTVFRVTPDGILSVVLSFSGGNGPFPGATPYAGLVQGTDGNLYGTCGTEGTRGAGNVFRIIMPGPELTSSQAGQQMLLSWRTNYPGFRLQRSEDPSSGGWFDCTNAPAIIGRKFFVTNSVQGGPQFFRLKK